MPKFMFNIATMPDGDSMHVVVEAETVELARGKIRSVFNPAFLLPRDQFNERVEALEYSELTGIVLRSSVQRFADAMELKLRKHDSDRGPRAWLNDSCKSIVKGISRELGEAATAVENLQPKRCRTCGHVENEPVENAHQLVADEAVDVGNFAMMLHDIAQNRAKK